VTILLGVLIAATGLDAASKLVVTAHLVEGRLYGRANRWGLRRVHNHRGSVGALSVRQSATLWVTLAVCFGLVLALAPAPGVWLAVGLGLALGGAAGNLTDRFLHGSVVDFVAIGPWPVFNLADAAMVAGVVLLAGSMM
jgi:signal peptidase II